MSKSMPYAGAALRGLLPSQDPRALLQFLLSANVVLYLTALAMDPGTVGTRADISTFLSPGVLVLVKLGASGELPVFAGDRWWTLITANYLHGSLVHVAFNVAALNSVGRTTLPIFGPTRLFLIYFFGGILAMGASSLAGIPLTLGASGAVCALIGAMSYDDWRAAKGNLKERILSVGIWVLFIVLIGVALPNVNNWAHAVGFGSGFLLGYCFWPRTTLGESNLFRVTASLALVLTIATLIYGLLFS